MSIGRTLKSRKLELVHRDSWGSSLTPSLRGSRYYYMFIDNHNRKVWVCLLKYKSNVFDVFKKWKGKKA